MDRSQAALPHDAPVRTAGAYVSINGRYPFVIGPTPTGQRLAVVRLGGHRDAEETPWQCAAREVAEEAGVIIEPITPSIGYWLDRGRTPEQIQPDANRPARVAGAPAPVLIITTGSASELHAAVMYLAQTTGHPIPSGEVRGLLLLRPQDIQQMVHQPTTLRQYLDAGGQVLLRDTLDRDWLLEPFIQLRAFAQILALHPELGHLQ
jgi:8-oxo-dGTP pyrophosphatase MutT (NUDIX family)